MDDLAVFLDRVDALVAKLEPAQQRELSRKIGTEIRRRNATRIKSNTEPDGSGMAARRGKNLRRLRANGSLRAGQPFYYYGRLVSLTWVKDYGERFIGGYAAGDSSKVGVYLRSHVKLASKANKRMFRRLSMAKWLKTKTEAGSATVGFWTGSAARVAAEHQSGSRKNLPPRTLLGFSPDDIEWIEQSVIEYLAEAL